MRDCPLYKEKEKQKTEREQGNETTNQRAGSGLDLASLLQGEEGFFLCQNRGQDYIDVAKAGHSIAYWADASRSGDRGTAVSQRCTGALGRY